MAWIPGNDNVHSLICPSNKVPFHDSRKLTLFVKNSYFFAQIIDKVYTIELPEVFLTCIHNVEHNDSGV